MKPAGNGAGLVGYAAADHLIKLKLQGKGQIGGRLWL